MLSVFQIRLIHTVIFFVLSACVLYAVYSALFGSVTVWTWVALLLVAVEGLILAVNDWQCPLTVHAERRGAARGSVADLFLPRWFADRLFWICGLAAGAAAVLVVFQWLTGA